MKAGDLMIGDWVQYQYTEGIFQIVAISKTEGIKQFGDQPFFKLNGIIPIPLTPEILEKNGILYSKSSFYYIINDDKDLECTHYMYQTIQEDWAIGVDTGAYECSVFARIKYVHELQHLLRALNINKEIEL